MSQSAIVHVMVVVDMVIFFPILQVILKDLKQLNHQV